MSPSLNTGVTVAHFRIVAPLGEGGMGEVYKAWDTQLDREVALKILPPDRVLDEERLGRFVREAKSASALAHPNIVTIHEIGRDTVEGDGSPADVHYIAMELVEGPTLQELIHERRADLRTLLGYLAQAAGGIARAHEAGVVHRDLKPENIMVTRDGYAKVLDFGLAKLDAVADPDSDATSAPTAYAETAEGMMMGTVGYMSPEQVHGRNVDHRTDVFAFGCLLYEAATRHRPFVADSSIDVLHKIVHDPPPPMEEIEPGVPAALRRLVNRCLAKDPERRAQSMRDLALELDDLVAEFDTLPPSSASGISRSGAALPAAPGDGRERSRWPWAALGVVLALVLVGGGWWVASRNGQAAAAPKAASTRDAFQTMEIEPLTADGTITRAALSPDGRYLAHTRATGGEIGLWIRQVATGSEIGIVPPQDLSIRGISFTPDGDYLYFVRSVPDRAGYHALYRVPTLGGEPRQIAFDVDAGVTFSPDGERFAFPRGIPHENRSALLVADVDGSDVTELASLDLPDRFPLARATWSPDGATIVAMVQRADDILSLIPTEIDLETGALAPFPGEHRFSAVAGLEWLPDGSGIVVVGRREIVDTGHQIWLVERSSGELRRISNDINDYGAPSLSADGSTLATVLAETVSHLYAVPADGEGEPLQLTGGRREIAGDLVAGTGDNVFFQLLRGDRVDLWRTTVDGEPERLATDGIVINPAVSADGRLLLVTLIGDDHRPHVWRLDPDTGTAEEQLTDGDGEVGWDVTPDGENLFFNTIREPVLWRRPVAGGEEVEVAAQGGQARVSPDGRFVVYGGFEEIDGQPGPVLVVSTLDGEVRQRLPWSGTGRFFWHPDGDALVVDREHLQVGNLWELPLDGTEPRRITSFEDRFVIDADWSSDGEWIFVTRGETTSDVVLVRNFR